MSSFEPSERADEVETCEEVARGLLVTCRDCAELLDDIEEALDQVSLAAEREIAGSLGLAVRFRRDDRLDASQFEALDEAVCVIALVVGEHRLYFDLFGKRLGLRDVVSLAAGEADDERIAERVDDGVDLRRQPAARSAYGLVAPFFIAPALC